MGKKRVWATRTQQLTTKEKKRNKKTTDVEFLQEGVEKGATFTTQHVRLTGRGAKDKTGKMDEIKGSASPKGTPSKKEDEK